MGIKVREKVKGSGVYWFFIDHRGKRKAKKFGTDKQAALIAAKKIQAKLTLGEMDLDNEKKRSPTFGEYAKTWIEVTVPATCKEISVADYRGLLNNHILPVFEKTPVTEITRLMVKEFLMKKARKGKKNAEAGYASSTITHIKNALSGVLNLAVDDETIGINPAQKLGKITREKGLRLQFDPLTREELARLLAVFREHYPKHYPMALTLCRTGIRIGEALGLQWGDIDFNSRFITIQRGRSKSRTETPKNGKCRRVDMSRQLTEVLLELRRQRMEEKLRKGWKEMPPWVFITEVGTPLIEWQFRERVFNRALEKAKLRKVRVHDLRHSYASLLIQAGESLAYVRDQLGHHSIKVTVDIYGHLAPEGNKAAVDRLDDILPTHLAATQAQPEIKKELTENG